MNTGVTSFSQNTYDIHQMIMWACVVIVIVVYCIMIYAIIKHRISNRAGAAAIYTSTKMEVFWALISFLILITLAIPAIQNLLDMEHPTRSNMPVVAPSTASITISHQFMINASILYSADE